MVTISPFIRGEMLKEDEVLLTLKQGGILISPYRDGDEVAQNYCTKSKFSNGRLYLPSAMLTATRIKRMVTITIQEDGTLLLEPGERCLICGSRKNLHYFNADQQICQDCLRKAVRF